MGASLQNQVSISDFFISIVNLKFFISPWSFLEKIVRLIRNSYIRIHSLEMYSLDRLLLFIDRWARSYKTKYLFLIVYFFSKFGISRVPMEFSGITSYQK